MHKIYLDNNATTMIDPNVLSSMLPYFNEHFGNPNAMHLFGYDTIPAIEESCDDIYSSLGASDEDTIIITSGATESINTVHRHILDLFLTKLPKKNQIITSPMEHPAVENSLKYLEKFGIEIISLPLVDDSITIKSFLEVFHPEKTLLISMMLASNETGVILPIAELLEVTAPYGIPFHTDATQYVGKIPIDLQKLPVDFLSFSAHKFHGPKGVGGLFIRKKTAFTPLIYGGAQMGGLRGGTLNTPLIVGLGKALKIATESFDANTSKILYLRDQLEEFLMSIENTTIYGKDINRIPNTTFVNIKGIDADYLVWKLNKSSIATSTGSACSTKSLNIETIDDMKANKGVRFSLSKFTSEEEIQTTIKSIAELL